MRESVDNAIVKDVRLYHIGGHAKVTSVTFGSINTTDLPKYTVLLDVPGGDSVKCYARENLAEKLRPGMRGEAVMNNGFLQSFKAVKE